MGNNNLRMTRILGLVILTLLILLGILSCVNERFQVSFLSLLILGPPLWTYFNARSARCRDALFWGLLALFANVVGMILYYLIGRGEPPVGIGICPYCQRPLNPDQKPGESRSRLDFPSP